MGQLKLTYKKDAKVFLKDGLKVGSIRLGRGQAGKVVEPVKAGFLRTEYKVDFGSCVLVLRENQIK